MLQAVSGLFLFEGGTTMNHRAWLLDDGIPLSKAERCKPLYAPRLIVH